MAITLLVYSDITHTSFMYKLSVYVSFTLISFFLGVNYDHFPPFL